MRMFKRITVLFNRVIHSLENSKAPFLYFVLTFFFAATLRNFLEIFSDNLSFSTPQFFVHYYASYIALAMSLILLFYFLTKTNITKVAKVILPSFIILNLAPVLDLILSRGRGYNIAYLLPGVHNNLFLRYFTFFGKFPGYGITPGMKIEIGIILLGSFFYFYSKNLKLIKSLFSTVLVYTLIFCYTATPFAIKKALELSSLEFKLSDSLFINFYLVVVFFTGILLAYSVNKQYFKAIIKDIRPFRLIHYELMFFLGLILGTKYNIFYADWRNFHLIFIPISIAFAWLFSVFINNIEDYKIDKISNRERPLIKSEITLGNYKKLGWLFLGLAFLYGGAVNFQTLFIVLLFIGNYFLYSASPLRLKRVPFLSKLVISFNSLILVMLGFIIITGSISRFPGLIIAVFLIGFTAIANFIDIKDYKGDKQIGIKTLPVILGSRKAKLIIGLFFIFTYLSVYFLIKDALNILEKLSTISYLFILGIVQFYLINKKNYDEKYIFLVYFFSLVVFIILFL